MTYPKIGIRPTIDGRWGGVRESLEAQTMGMATAAKALIEENLHYPDGTPVQCVLSPTTIGGGAEAAKCAEYFAGENVVATLTVTPRCVPGRRHGCLRAKGAACLLHLRPRCAGYDG